SSLASHAGSSGLFGPALQFFQAADVLAIDEHLRHGAAAGNRADHARAVAVVEPHLAVLVAEVLQQLLRLGAVTAAFAREDRHLVGLLRPGIDVPKHGVGVGDFEGIPGLLRLYEHLLDDAVLHQHRIAPRAPAEA